MKMMNASVMVTVVAGSVLLSGCASTYQKRSVEGSGFLSDYSQLRDLGGDTALRSYIDPKVDFREYNKIMIDPIKAYAKDKKSSMAKLSKEDQQTLLNYFDAALREQLKTDYILVNAPGPGVMRLRVAVTEASGSKVVLDTVSTVLPIGLVASAASRIITGEHLSVGDIGAEIEGVDAQTGKRLFAAIDARVGRKVTFKFDKFGKWHTAKDAMDFWANKARERLAELRAAGGKSKR
jgi:Protein of unknown function (DUF3313)